MAYTTSILTNAHILPRFQILPYHINSGALVIFILRIILFVIFIWFSSLRSADEFRPRLSSLTVAPLTRSRVSERKQAGKEILDHV